MPKKSTRLKTAAAEIRVPQSLEEVSADIAEIGRCQRERDRIQAEMNDNLATVRAEYEAQAKPHADRISELHKGVTIYSEAHRDELTRGGKTKTVRLATGELSWRTRPPSVRLPGGPDAVVKALKALGLTRFLRVKEEVDKEAILAEPAVTESVRGISISQKEDFVIKPDSTELEEVR